MRTETEKLLPKMMPGTVHAQFVRCGKINCKCSNGELHGAYYYHFVRVGGRLRKRYLKPSEVEDFESACRARQVAKKSEVQSNNAMWTAIRTIREELRGITNLYGHKENLKWPEEA